MQTTQTGRRIPKLRWEIGVLLGIGVLINYFDRVNLSVAAPDISKEFSLTPVQIGFLLSGFFWIYTVLQIPVGLILDRFGVKSIGRWGSFLWGIASGITALATGFWTIMIARGLLGIAEAPGFPANSKAVSYWFPKRERGLATAIFDSAAKFSSAIAAPFVAFFVVAYGWRGAFVVTAIISVLYFVAFFVFYRNPSEHSRLTPEERDYIQSGGAQPEGVSQTGGGATLVYLLAQKKVWGASIGFAAYGYSFYLFLTWLPGFLAKQEHMSIIKSGWYTAIPWIVAGISDLVVGGWLIDYLIQKGHDANRVRKTVLIGGMILGIAVFGAATTSDPNVAIFWISVALAGLAASAPVAWSIPGLIAPKGSVGTVGGIMNCLNNGMGIAAPIVTGFIVQGTGSFTNAFVTAGVVILIGIAFYAFVLGRIDQAIPDPA